MEAQYIEIPNEVITPEIATIIKEKGGIFTNNQWYIKEEHGYEIELLTQNNIDTQASNNTTVIPATKTYLSKPKCLFVQAPEDNKDRWLVFGHFKSLGKDGFTLDEVGWYFKNVEIAPKLEEICLATDLKSPEVIDTPLGNFEHFKLQNTTFFHTDKASDCEAKFDALKHNQGINTDIKDGLTSEQRQTLQQTNNGKLIVDYVEQYQKHQKAIARAEKAERLSKIPLDTKSDGRCKLANEAIKNSLILDKIKQKRVEFKKTGCITLSGISTGFKSMDDVIDGFQPGHLIVLAGRASMGKTFVAMNYVNNIAIVQKIPTAILSLEMSNLQLFYRLISLSSGIRTNIIKGGTSTDDELADIEAAISKIQNSPLLITEDPTNSKFSILEVSIENAVNDGAKIVFVDHVGLIQYYDGLKDNRANEVGAITSRLKIMAKKFAIPIVVLAQLNRGADTDVPPKLSNLRESGSLEQDADIVIFVHRSDYFNRDTRPFEVDIIIAKNRDGEQGITLPFKRNGLWLLSETQQSQIEQQPYKPSVTEKPKSNNTFYNRIK
jgi:replicative DNA helicase